MKQINYDTVEIVHKRKAVMEHSRQRAMRSRMKQIEKIVVILRRLVMAAAFLMVMTGAGMIDSGLMITTQLYGVMMMLGGFFVLGGCVKIGRAHV